MRSLAILLLLCSSALAEITILPLPDSAIAIATSATEGRWLIFRAAPFGLVQGDPVVYKGQPGTLWTGVGTYTAVLLPHDQTVPYETADVTIGVRPGPDPDPDPDPDPEPDPEPDPDPGPTPPPGARKVIVLAEESDATGAGEIAITMLRRYVQGKSEHTWGLYDPDQFGSVVLKDYLEAAKDVGLPALLIFAKDANGNDVVSAFRFPDPGTTAESGVIAGNKALKLLKEAGG